MSKPQDYPLGYSAEEAQRLAEQAAHVEALTEDLFRRAGVSPGMHVLDLGCGVGDVSLLAGRIVGAEGAVLGIDRAESSVEAASHRAAEQGAAHVAFQKSELGAFETERMFDAIVGRFVLSYVPDRVDMLRKLTRRLKPGGVVAFQELDMSQIAETPPSALFTEARRWLLEGFAAGGVELDMGTKLFATYRQAGLPAPTLLAFTPGFGGSVVGAYESMVQVLRSLLPVIERNGIANTASMDLDTLAQRLRADAAAHERVVFLSRIVGAWARLA